MSRSRDTADQINRLNSSAANATAITIDSSENVLVGKTAVEYDNTAGHIFRNDGLQSSIRSGGNVADFNRLSNDGEIIRLSKDGTTVGSIGTLGSRMSIGTGDVGLFFNDQTDQIQPINTTTNAPRDNAISLGASDRRFKDLYLSGGVYLGGTGAANKLTDYEFGTWTPFWGGSVSDPSQSYALQSGRYTKIGRMVYVSFIIISSGTPSGGSGDLLIAGLPFANYATNIQTQGYIGIVNNISNDMGASQLMLVGQSASTNVNVMKCSGSSTTSSSNLAVSACHNSGSRIDGTFIYSIA